MNARLKRLFVVTSILVSMTAAVGFGSMLGDVAKVGGVGIIVSKFSKDINKFVNTMTANKNLGTQQATAVVPIISIGGGSYIGAAQVIGTKANVAKCKAVVQIEGNAVFGKNIRAKALIPVGSKTTSNIKRIYGVGVSALIDVKI